MISLTIQHWNGKDTFKVEIDSTEYIDDLKEKIEELHDVPVDEQRLSFKGKEVDDTETIEENGIVDDSTLVLEPMKVTVLLPSGKGNKIRLTLKPDDVVKKIKRAVSKKTNNSKLEGFIVLFDGQELRDGQKIGACNIDHGDVVIVEYYMITVAHWKGDLIDINEGQITGQDTTEQVKEILLQKDETKDIPREQMKFKFGGNVINDFLSLKDQKVKHKAVLQLEKPHVKKEKQKFQLSVFPTDNPADKKSKSITVTVKHWNGSTFNIEIDPNQYIEELKEKIQETQSIPIDQQRLQLDGEPIDDTETLVEAGIEDKMMLILEAMRIVVEIPGPKVKKLRFVVVPDDNIKRIKRMVVKKTGLPADRQRVLFNGNDLKDSQKLGDCGIDHEDILTIDTYCIFVHHWDGESYEIKDELSPNDTTDDVKRILVEKHQLDIPKEQIKLLYQGKDINDFLSLKDQKIEHRGVLNLQEPPKQVKKREKFKLSMIGTDDPLKAKKAGETQSIEIKTWKGESFKIEIGSFSDTVEDLKAKIEKYQKIPKGQQRLTYNGHALDDSETLEEHSIDSTSVINMEAMKIHVMMPNGKKIRFAVSLDDSVKRIKKVVAKKSGISIESQCLLNGGTELNDGQKLSECGIEHDDVLTVEEFSISVLHFTGDIFVLPDVQPTDTMEDVRNIILKRKNIPKDRQKFKFEGRNINDFLSLKDQKIRHKSIIMMEDLEIIKSPQKKRPTISNIKLCDTSDEDSLGDDDASDDFFKDIDDDDDDEDGSGSDGESSQASWIKRAAHDEEYTANLAKIDTDDPESSYLSKLAHEQKQKADAQ